MSPPDGRLPTRSRSASRFLSESRALGANERRPPRPSPTEALCSSADPCVLHLPHTAACGRSWGGGAPPIQPAHCGAASQGTCRDAERMPTGRGSDGGSLAGGWLPKGCFVVTSRPVSDGVVLRSWTGPGGHGCPCAGRRLGRAASSRRTVRGHPAIRVTSYRPRPLVPSTTATVPSARGRRRRGRSARPGPPDDARR